MARKKKRKDPEHAKPPSRTRFLPRYANLLTELLRVNPRLKPSQGLKAFKSALISADGQLPDDLPTDAKIKTKISALKHAVKSRAARDTL